MVTHLSGIRALPVWRWAARAGPESGGANALRSPGMTSTSCAREKESSAPPFSDRGIAITTITLASAVVAVSNRRTAFRPEPNRRSGLAMRKTPRAEDAV